MGSITQVLSDPGAWVSGILFSLIATAIYKLVGHLPSRIRGVGRARRLKNLKSIRVKRENPMEISYAIGKANAQFVAFLLMFFFYLAALLVSNTLSDIINQSVILGVIVGSPIFVFELLWLFQDLRAQKLIKEHGKILRYRRY